MTSIKKYAKYLKLFLIFIVIPMLIYIFIKNITNWVNGYIPKEILATVPVFKPISSSIKTLAIIIDTIIPFIILFFGLIYFIKILDLLKTGEVFSKNVFYFFKKLTTTALVWVIYHPIGYTILLLTLTINNPKGHRYLELGFSSTDALNILLFGLLLIMTSLMHQGLLLKKETDLTV
ncbi:MAG: hypothetical protein SZ59_C0002G0294 [candidate division TM6 bacterium GW2011_GWF2_28_16]|nr:MAG: hypothetical protein SZ59_C0002G0294 [candidate division TM6 bacterium GW2011_GWF2_28_16]